MRRPTLFLAFLSLLSTTSCGLLRPPFPADPGNIFLRARVCDPAAFRSALSGLVPQMKAKGFSAYSLHQDLKDPGTYLLTLKCSNLNRGMAFLQAADLPTGCPGEKEGQEVLWCGTDLRERTYQNNNRPSGGIVIARNEVKSYDFWKKGFEAEGQHHHADRGYEASRYSIHHLEGDPASVIVVHHASDVSKAPAFMTAPAMKGVMESLGVTKIDIWYGTDLEERVF